MSVFDNLKGLFAATLWGGLALTPLPAGAAVITVGPADCSAAAVNAAIASAADGDTVKITGTGTVTWTATVTLPSTKGIRLIGPGTNTPKGSASFPLVIISNAKPAISITPENGRSLYQVSGFKFRNPNLSSDFSGYWYNSFISVRGRGIGSGGKGCYRIDNNYFDHVGNDTMIGLDGSTGELTGVVDNNTFLDVGQSAVVYVIRIRETWKGSSSSCNGGDAWQRNFAFGDSHFHFIEDNLFSRPTTEGRHDISCDGAGGKFVVRYNTFNRSYGSSYQLDYVDAHGDGTPGLAAGTRGGEIYGNTFQGSGSAVYRDVSLRGGQWLVYNNTFPSYGHMAMTEYRASGDCWQLQSPSPCDPGVPQCAGSGDFTTWYPLPGQIRGSYFWNNIYNSANLAPELASEGSVGTYIKINRDYWVSASKPTALANYVAFTYPHPLVNVPGGGGGGNTNPIISVSVTSVDISLPQGSTTNLTITVKNIGTNTLSGRASLSVTNPWTISGSGTVYSLTAGASANFTLSYAQGAALSSSATLTLTGGGGATVPLLGGLPKTYIQCVGDSLTRGGSSTTTNFVPGGYRLPLYQLLTNAGVNVVFTGNATNNGASGLPYPEHDGYGGYTIGDIASDYPSYAAGIHRPDYVLLQCGFNDFRLNDAIAAATNRLMALITEIYTNFPTAKIIVADMNPWDNLAAINNAMNTYYNPYIPSIVSNQVALGRSVYLADMRQPYMTVSDVMSGDNTHLTQSGYSKMATKWMSVIAITSGNYLRPPAPQNLRVLQP